MITSPNNKRVAGAVRLKKRAMREKDRRFLVEGPAGVAEAVSSAAAVHDVFFTADPAARLDPVLSMARAAGVPTHEVSPELIGRLTSTVTPQGVVASVGFVDVPIEALPPAPACVPVLVEVRDPGNAGAILRSADAAGADAVVVTRSSVDLYNDKAVRATAGSLFHVPVVRGVEVAEAAAALRERGMRILAAEADGEASVHDVDLTRPTAFLLGNEAHGLAARTQGIADGSVRVPILGRAESLNLAAAAALLLFESARQRSARPAPAPAEGGDEVLARIVAGAAHDIRSPLAATVGFTSTLLRMWERLDDEQRLTMIRGVAFDAGRMRAMVAQLVDAARIASGRLELSLAPSNLLEAAERVAAELTHPDLPAVVAAGEPVEVLADAARIQTILRALAESASWWGEEGPVRITVTGSPGPTVQVTRAGTAFDAAAASELFAPRAPGSGGGSKVGLYVAKGLAEAHGGTVSARADGGIHLILTLPPR